MRILYVNRNELVLYLPDKRPFTLFNSSGRVLDMLDEFLSPMGQTNFIRLSDFSKAVERSEELTLDLDIDFSLVLEYANLCM